MPIEKIVNATGTIDGANRAFSVGEGYQPGSLVPRWNGQEMLHRDGNPFTETDPATGAFTTDGDFLPTPGDTLSARFVDLSPAGETEVVEIFAVLELETEITATLLTETSIVGTVEGDGEVSSTVTVETPINATVENEIEISATVEVCG